ncbi:MAG: hypothetical protein H7144_03670 [Burkholderiales bacterium]|nr:hypothetical protein [Phycisphaerae bacterium]
MKQFLRYLLLIACVMTVFVWAWSYFYIEGVFYDNTKSVHSFQLSYGTVAVANTGAGAFTFSSLPFQITGPMLDPLRMQPPGFSMLHQRHPFKLRGNDGVSVHVNLGVSQQIIYGDLDPLLPTLRSPSRSNDWFISVPLWQIFSVLFLLTLAVWYRPIRTWLRGTNRQGFEVAVNDSTKPGLR